MGFGEGDVGRHSIASHRSHSAGATTPRAGAQHDPGVFAHVMNEPRGHPGDDKHPCESEEN